jgi:diguanylate cyclase (GGDEF)-like protein
MSMLIHAATASDQRNNRAPAAWSRWQAAGVVDPMLDRAMALAGLGAWSCNLADERLSWTSGVYELFGLPPETAIDRRETLAMYIEESRATLERLRGAAIATRGSFTLDAQIRRADGAPRWMRVNGEVVCQADGTRLLHGMKQDVTEEKARFEALRRLAENDALTGLANRTIFEAQFLNRDRAAPDLPVGALILFDLDGFKAINDRYGHLAGDACLQAVAERLAASFPEAVVCARIGGDEFAVILSDEQAPATVEAKIAAFAERLRAPVAWQGHLFTIGATSGSAVPENPICYDAEALFARADAALYVAKRTRRRRRTDRR